MGVYNMKKTVSLMLTVALIFVMAVSAILNVYAPVASAENSEPELEAVEIATGSTVGTRLRWELVTIGASFNVTSGFTKIVFPQAWGSNPANGETTEVIMELFNFKDSYEESVKGEPVYTRTFTSDSTETPEATGSGNFNNLTFDFGKVLPAGAYSLRLTLTSGGDTYFVPPSAAAKYATTQVMYTDFVFNFTIYFVKSEGEYFKKFEIEGLLDLKEVELTTGARDNNPVELGEAEISMKFTVPEGMKLYSITIPSCPTWGNREGGSDARADIYAWKGDYDKTIAEKELAFGEVHDHTDGDNAIFMFENQLPAGEYLAVFYSIGEMRFGFYGGGTLTEGVQFFRDGWDTDFSPIARMTLLENSEVKEFVSRDQLTVDGADKAKVGGNDEVTDIDLTDLTGKELRIWGWYASNISTPVFGYKVDNGSIVYGEFAKAAEDGVKNAAKENVGTDAYAARYEIMVPITDGDHTVTAYVRLANGERAIWTIKYKNGPEATEVPTAAPTEVPTEKPTEAPTENATTAPTSAPKPTQKASQSGGKGLPTGAVIGIIAGVLVIAGIAAALILKKKK